MCSEDLEIHQTADTDEGKQFLPLKDSLVHGLQRGEGILHGGSLPSLMNVSSQQNGKEDVDVSTKEDISTTNHKEQEKTFIKVAVDHNY